MEWRIRAELLLLVSLLVCARGDPPQTKVSCLYGRNCILPSSDEYGASTIINWDYIDGDLNVHSFYFNKDQLQHQDPRFQGRTSLVQDQISRTKTALMLKDVKVQDEGTYKCFLANDQNEDQTSLVDLQVFAPVQRVDVRRAGNSATCSSEGVYPRPELTWSTQPPSNGRAPSNSTVQQEKETKLYNISSSLKLSDRDGDVLLSCTVSTPLYKWTSTLRELRTNRNWAHISCSYTRTSLKFSSLVWRFNHRDVIMEWSSTGGPQVSAEWRRHVVSEEDLEVLHVQDLSSDQEGTYSCERSSAEETTATHTLLRLINEKKTDWTLLCGMVGVGVALLVFLVVLWKFCHLREGLQNFTNRSPSLHPEAHQRSDDVHQTTNVSLKATDSYRHQLRTVDPDDPEWLHLYQREE